MSKRRDINEIREELKKEGYTLISDKYVSNKEKLKMKHDICGYEFEMRYNSFASEKQRCPQCANKIRGQKAKERQIGIPKLDRRSNPIEKNKLIDERCGDDYTRLNSFETWSSHIKIKHNKCGKVFLTLFEGFVSKKTECPYCHGRNQPKEIDIFKKEVFDLVGNEYEVLGDYINTREKILIKHNICKSEYLVSPYRFLQGDRCPICRIKSITEKIKYSKDTFQEVLDEKFNKEYEIVGDYNGVHSPIKIKHVICENIFESVEAGYIRDSLIPCPICRNTGRSADEKLVEEFINKFAPSVHYREGRHEIDIFCPEKNIGFEYDGIYWHSEDKKGKTAHIDKTKYFNEKGIRIVHIFSDEWKFKQDIIKDKIKSILGVQKEKIYARKCSIKEINSRERNQFLEINHIQGSDGAAISLGLFYSDELVAVMSFSKLRKSLGQKKSIKGIYELSRFAGKLNYTIVGGFSKLLKYAIKNYDIEEIITYADLRFTSYKNNVYDKNGFVLDHISEPTYWYMDKSADKREHRYKYRKQELKKLFPVIYFDDKSESEIMKEAGYTRIWDCGNLVYKMKINK